MGGAQSMSVRTLDRYMLSKLGLIWAAKCCVFYFILFVADVGINDHISVTVDVSMAESVNMAIRDVIKHYSRPPSVVVNSAGITRDNFLLKMDEKWFQKVIDVNLKVAYSLLNCL